MTPLKAVPAKKIFNAAATVMPKPMAITEPAAATPAPKAAPTPK